MSEVTVRLAQRVGELEAAYRLLNEEYVRCGYDDPDPSGMRFLPCYALPTTRTFVALRGTEVIGTVTLVDRGVLGLPMEALFGREILRLQAPGRRLAEVSGLAVRAPDRILSLLLFRAMTGLARWGHQVTDLCITVNAAHEKFYADALLFERIGPVRLSPQVKGATAVPMRTDLTSAVERIAARHPEGIIGRYLAPWGLERDGTAYSCLARELQKGDGAATLARLSLAQRMMAKRTWEPRQKKAIARECRETTRRFFRKELAAGAAP